MNSRATAKHALTRADIIPAAEYAATRRQRRQTISELKKRRRLEVGPFATFFGENYETMWRQVHEMLHVEKGGEAQIADELEAYNPMIPQGSELTATIMLEIDDPVRRANVLARLGGIENHVFLEIAGDRVAGEPDATRENTSPDGGGVASPSRCASSSGSVSQARANRPLQGAGCTRHRRVRPSELFAHGGDARGGPRRARGGFRLARRPGHGVAAPRQLGRAVLRIPQSLAAGVGWRHRLGSPHHRRSAPMRLSDAEFTDIVGGFVSSCRGLMWSALRYVRAQSCVALLEPPPPPRVSS